MNKTRIRTILKDLDHVRTGGSAQELHAAEYLERACRSLGADTRIEPFEVPMAEMRHARLTVAGKEIPCEGYLCCGSASVEAPLVYLPGTDPVSLTRIRGSVVLLDTGVSYWVFRDLIAGGAAGFITYDGNVRYADRDIDRKELRSFVACGEKLPGVNINAKDALFLVKNRGKTVRLEVEQREFTGLSRNVVAELPGTSDEWIALSAHYDSTSLSRGAYDNLSGCIGLLEILEAMKKDAPHRYGLRFVFCGSEERGLLGSKAYTAAHEEELGKIALNINLDMIGTHMGKFIAVVSAEDALVGYIRYTAAELGWGLEARQGVYSSDSTPFADKGVPAVSFARIAPQDQATIHNRYDTAELLSEEALIRDGGFLAAFTRRMADAAVCPVKREIPEKVRGELDVYLNRKRKND